MALRAQGAEAAACTPGAPSHNREVPKEDLSCKRKR
jgi:hypothetical protein